MDPLFTALSGVLAHASITVSTYIFKLTAALGCLGTVAILWRSARVRGVDPVRGAVLFGLNPLVVLYGVGGGHNDLLMLLPMVAGVYAVLRSQDRKAGAMFVIAAAVKLTGALVAPFAYAAPELAGDDGRRRALLFGVGVTTAAVMAIGFGLFGVGTLHLPLILSQVQSEGDWHSIPGFISTAMLLPGLASVVGVILAVGFVACSARLLWHVWHGRIDWLEGAAWATVAILVCAGSLLPWYVAWLLPLVALCEPPPTGARVVVADRCAAVHHDPRLLPQRLAVPEVSDNVVPSGWRLRMAAVSDRELQLLSIVAPVYDEAGHDPRVPRPSLGRPAGDPVRARDRR